MIFCIINYTDTLTISMKIVLYYFYEGNVIRPRILKFGRRRTYNNSLIRFYMCVFLILTFSFAHCLPH